MRRFEGEIDNLKRREAAAAHARAEILRLAEGQRTVLGDGFYRLAWRWWAIRRDGGRNDPGNQGMARYAFEQES